MPLRSSPPSLAGLRGVAFWTALVLIINQLAALAVHVSRSEAAAAGPQNLVILAVLGLIAVHAHRATRQAPHETVCLHRTPVRRATACVAR